MLQKSRRYCHWVVVFFKKNHVTAFQPSVDIKTVLSQLMERLSNYAASSAEVLPEFLQVEAFSKLSNAIGRVNFGPFFFFSPFWLINLGCCCQSVQTCVAHGLWNMRSSIVLQVIEAQPDMPTVGVVTLYSSLLTFTLHVHPDRLDYADQVLVYLHSKCLCTFKLIFLFIRFIWSEFSHWHYFLNAW